METPDSSPKLRIGIDVDGTFTDFALADRAFGGLVSVGSAERDYGVVIAGDEIDDNATALKRRLSAALDKLGK